MKDSKSHWNPNHDRKHARCYRSNPAWIMPLSRVELSKRTIATLRGNCKRLLSRKRESSGLPPVSCDDDHAGPRVWATRPTLSSELDGFWSVPENCQKREYSVTRTALCGFNDNEGWKKNPKMSLLQQQHNVTSKLNLTLWKTPIHIGICTMFGKRATRTLHATHRRLAWNFSTRTIATLRGNCERLLSRNRESLGLPPVSMWWWPCWHLTVYQKPHLILGTQLLSANSKYYADGWRGIFCRKNATHERRPIQKQSCYRIALA